MSSLAVIAKLWCRRISPRSELTNCALRHCTFLRSLIIEQFENFEIAQIDKLHGTYMCTCTCTCTHWRIKELPC